MVGIFGLPVSCISCCYRSTKMQAKLNVDAGLTECEKSMQLQTFFSGLYYDQI